MPSFIDSGYLAALQNVQPYDYFKDFSRGYNLFEQSPWSARNQQKTRMENMQMAMQQQRFMADQADRARQSQMEQMMAPYKLDLLRKQASAMDRRWTNQPGGGTASPYSSYVNEIDGAAVEPIGAPTAGGIPANGIVEVPLPVQDDTIPVLPQNALLADPNNPTPRMSLIPDAPF